MMLCVNLGNAQIRFAIKALLPVLLSFFMPSFTYAATSEILKYEYYEVTSVPNQELGELINVASPVRKGTRVFHGSTAWTVGWSISMQRLPNGTCKIKSSATQLNGTILLPKLINATESQGIEFIRYIGALKEHELGHYKYGQQALAAVDKAILAMPVMNNCIALENAVAKQANAISNDFTTRSRLYDVHTDHGRTQGAWLTLKTPAQLFY